MPISSAKADRLTSAILGQLELLHDLAIIAGDAELASDLSIVFSQCLNRYCEAKRTDLARTIATAGDALRRSA